MILNTSQIVTYILEAVAIALVSRYFLGKSALDRKVLILIITIAASHIVVDLFAPGISDGMRQGAGFGMSSKLIQSGGTGGLQGALGMKRSLNGNATQVGGMMDDPVAYDYYSHGCQLSGEVLEPKYAEYAAMTATDVGADGESGTTKAVAPAEVEAVVEDWDIPGAKDSIKGEMSKEINVIERFMDDREALEHYGGRN